MTGERKDVWASGAAYEPYVGRWSRPIAREFVTWLGVPRGRRWLDVGCGTGALSQTILQRCEPTAVIGIDPSVGFLGYAREQVRDARVAFQVADAQGLPFGDAVFDAAVSALVLNFVPDMTKAVAEMARVTRPGGTVAAYVWDYAGEMQMMRRFWDAAIALDPAVLDRDEARRFPVCKPDPLRHLFTAASLERIETRAIDVPTVFKDFDDYWIPFTSGQAPAPGYCMSLTEEKRATLRDHLRRTLPTAADGSIALIARAWAVRGKVAA
jgi:SAM-dependent methyltransferase